MTNPCKYCGNPIEFEAPAIALGVILKPNICAGCERTNTERAAQLKKDTDAALRLRIWQSLCPAEYRDTNLARLDQQKLAEVMAWQYGPKGLIVSGELRRGKTRCVWVLLRELIMQGRTVLAMTDGEFARSCAEHAREGSPDFFNACVRCDVLFIDDFGKCKNTERVETELFDIVEHRTRSRRPIIVTTNGTKKSFAEVFSRERGQPMLARLKEFCTSINFSTQQNAKKTT